jgi:hypothetical protein
VNPTCKTSNGSTELGETRIQAALLSLEIGIIVVTRISPRTQPGKADVLQATEGSSPGHDKVKLWWTSETMHDRKGAMDTAT